MAWRWGSAARGTLTALPAIVAATRDVELGAALAVGLVPICSLPLAPRRTRRLRGSVVGVLAACSIFVGGVLAQWPVVAVAGLVVVGGLLGHVAARGRPAAMLGLQLCLPLMAVGFSYPGTDKVGGLAVDILMGTAWATVVALAWPATRPRGQAPAAPAAPGAQIATYGWIAGLTGGICATVGFAAGLEHVGWAPAAALLVMRPDPPAQGMRSWDRLADVVLGAAAAICLVLVGPSDLVFGIVVGLVVVATTATAGSRSYVTPLFTTALVFLMLLAGHPGDAGSRFVERVLETALGVGVAALMSFVVLPAVTRRGTVAGSGQSGGRRPGADAHRRSS